MRCRCASDARAFVRDWGQRVADWMVILSDHTLGHEFGKATYELGRYTFAPVPCIEDGKGPRMSGDGPASWAVYAMVSRPRQARFRQWGSLPGAYVVPKDTRHKVVVGGKPVVLMRALVRDYSRPGDLICDPCAGGGTTLLAAVQEGRQAIGAELDPETFELAVKRLSRGYTPPLFAENM